MAFKDQAPENLTEQLTSRVLAQGEIRLQAQLAIALAADGRAITSASILIGISSAILGLAGVIYSATPPETTLAATAAFGAILLCISAAICAFAALPIKFGLAGANPKNWWEDDVTTRPYAECLWRESNNYGRRIAANVDAINANATCFKYGILLAAATPIICLLFWTVLSHVAA